MSKLDDISQPIIKACPYCIQKEDGGVDITKHDISFGALGKLEVLSVFWNFSEKFGAHLNIDLWHEWDVDSLYEESIEVNYCPWCGRDLRREHEGKERD